MYLYETMPKRTLKHAAAIRSGTRERRNCFCIWDGKTWRGHVFRDGGSRRAGWKVEIDGVAGKASRSLNVALCEAERLMAAQNEDGAE